MEQRCTCPGGVSASRQRLTLTRRHMHAGVHAVDGGTVLNVSSSCSISGSGVAGCSVNEAARVQVSDSDLSANKVGLEASGRGAQVTLVRTRVSHSTGTNVHVEAGADVEFIGGRCEGAGGKGVVVSHPGSLLRARDAVFTGNAVTGIAVNLMGRCDLTGCEIVDNKVTGLHVSVRPPLTRPVYLCAVLCLGFRRTDSVAGHTLVDTLFWHMHITTGHSPGPRV